MKYNDSQFIDCIDTAVEIVVEDHFSHIKDKNPYYGCGKYSHPEIQEFLYAITTEELVQTAQQIVKSDLRKNKHSSDFARECDREWDDHFTEWLKVTENYNRVKNSKLNRVMCGKIQY